MMVAAMVAGVVLHYPLSVLDEATGSTLAPGLIFLMLFITFCRVDVRDMSFSIMHLWLLLFQVAGSAAAYYLLLPLGQTIAQGGMICVLAPIATAAAVIGGLLGANVARIAAYSLLCNFIIALVAPLFLSLWGNGECTFEQILYRVFPMLVCPFLLAQLLKSIHHRSAEWIGGHGLVSFYLWLCSMAITLGRVSEYIVENTAEISLSLGGQLAFVALVICIIQFTLGRYIGFKYNDMTTCGQSLGQKNTVLAIWMAQMFLSPIAALAPTAYIIWQNLANSLQIYLHDRKR